MEESVAGLNEEEEHGLSQNDLHWYQNAGILKLSGARWPHQIGFAHIEYLDSLNAQTLLRAETKPSPTYRKLGERIESALARHLEHQTRTVRYLLNMVEADISSSPWDRWIRLLPDSVSQLRVVAERRSFEFGDISVLGEVISSLDPDGADQDTPVYWLSELLHDPNPQIVYCILGGIDAAFLSKLTEQVIAVVDRGDHHETRRLAAQRLLDARLADDRAELRTAITNWLENHQEPGHVEDALTLVGDFGLTWARELVHEVAVSDLPYSQENRFGAATVLARLEDPRGERLSELLSHNPVVSNAESAMDDVRIENFQTTLSTLTSELSDAEDQIISQEEQ